MHAIDVFGLAAAIVIALLAQIVQPRSSAWWTGMIIAGLVACAAVGDIAWEQSTKNARPILSGAQFDELKKISEFAGHKDEVALQQLFDFPSLIAKNVSMMKDMVRLRKQGKLKRFDITNYEEKNRQRIVDLRDAIPDSNGRLILPDDSFQGIIVTDRYVQAKQKLRDFETSPLVPKSVIDKLRLLDKIIDDNANALLDLFQEKIEQNDAYFLEYDTPDSKYQKAIDSLFSERSRPLEPAAAKIIEAIRQYLGTG
jgi:hypothetical protein